MRHVGEHILPVELAIGLTRIDDFALHAIEFEAQEIEVWGAASDCQDIFAYNRVEIPQAVEGEACQNVEPTRRIEGLEELFEWCPRYPSCVVAKGQTDDAVLNDAKELSRPVLVSVEYAETSAADVSDPFLALRQAARYDERWPFLPVRLESVKVGLVRLILRRLVGRIIRPSMERLADLEVTPDPGLADRSHRLACEGEVERGRDVAEESDPLVNFFGKSDESRLIVACFRGCSLVSICIAQSEVMATRSPESVGESTGETVWAVATCWVSLIVCPQSDVQ